MINDDQSFDSSGNASFDTSAAMRPGSVHELHEEKLFGGDLSSRRSSSNHVLPIDSMNEVFSLEMARQEEIKRQAIINALNQFIVQAGNIYKGNKLSTTDKNKLHDAATHAGLSVKVVDALLKQTAAQNAAVEYCFNSDDVIVRRIKEDPQLSESILEKGKNNLLEGRVDGLNVSSSVWRIFLHKIIKQFLKEQNMELGDIMEKSSQTRKVYEDALRCDPSENNIFDVSKRPRDYSEERKHVFISQADAKLARLEASEAMVKFQQCKNVSVYDLVDGTSIQRHRGLPPAMPKTEVYFHDSRDDDLSMVACAPKRESSFNNWKETNTTENKKLNDTLSIIPVLEEGSTSSPEKIGAIQQEDDILTTTTFSTLIHKGTPPSQITIESRDDEKNAHNTTPKEMKRDCQSPPTSVASPKENNYSRTSLYSSESKALWSPIADKERAVPNSTPGRSKVSDAVIQKIAVFESNFDSTKAKSDSSKIRKRQSLQNVNVFQARAIFDADSSQSKQSPQIKQVPNQKALPSGNVSQARAIFDADSSQSKQSPQIKQVPNQKTLPYGNVSQARAIFDADSSQSTQSPQIKQVPNQKALPYGNVSQARAIFDADSSQSKHSPQTKQVPNQKALPSGNVSQTRAIFDADSSQYKQSLQIKQVGNQKAPPSTNVSQARAIFDADSSQSKHSPQTKQVPNQKALPSGNVSEVQAIFDADSSQSTQSPQTKQVPNQKTLLYANVSEVQAIFDADSSQLKAKSPQIQEVQAIFDADSSQSKQSPQIKEVPNRSTLSSVTVSKVQEMLATDSSQLKQKSTQNDQVSDRSALRSGNVPEVRELFSVDSSQPNLYSSKQKKAAKNQNVLSSDKVSQARAVFEKKDEQIAVGPEPIRKGQNAKIQDVLATLTQKGQCDNMLSSEHETEIKRFKASGMEDRKQNRVKESPRATRDQENVTDEDCKGCTKRRAPQCDHSVLEDKTSSFQNKSYAEETVRIQRAQFGTEQSRLGNAEDPEFKFQPNSAIKSTSVDFDEVVTNNDFCDSNHSGNDVEDVCQARAPDCTPLILPHSLELSSTDESVGAHHPPIFTENFKLASDTSNRLSDGPDEDVRDNSRKLHFHAQYTKKETPKEQIISSLVHYSDIPRDQNCESVSFLTFEDTRSDKSFKRSSFGDFLKPDTIEVVEDLVMGAHNQLHTSLAYINSESDDSDEVPIPPPTKPRKVEPCQVETTSTTKKDQKVTLCTDDVIDLSELSDQNAWAAFDSNNTFHEETRIHSHFKDNTFDHNRTKSKKVENSSPKRVEFREISNTSMKTKFKSWANFESNEIVRTQFRESVIQNENKKEIKNLEVGDTMTPKRVQPTRKSNVDRECDSPEDNGPMEKKERRKTPKEKRNVQNHACSTLENDINKDLPNAFLSDFAALAIPNQEIVLERPFGGDSSESRKNKDLPSNPSALGTSSNYKMDFKSGQKKGIPQNKIRNEECTNIDVKSQEIVKTGVRGDAPELIQEKELMGSQANAYFESLLLNKSSSSCVHEDKIFKNVSSQEAHQSSSDDEAYFENLLLKKTSSPFFDDDSCYRNFRSENAPNGEKFYPRAETSNKQECKEHSFEAAEISLSIDHQPLSNRQTRKEMSSLRESYGHISWEQFASNFSHNADVEDSPLRESNAHQKVNNNLSNVKDKNKLELNQSPLTSNKDTDKREETTNSSDWHNGNSQDFLLMKEFSSAGQVGGIAFVETNNRCVPHVDERVLPENQLERKNRVSGKFHDEDIVGRDELETKFSNLNLHSISSIQNPANIASEERKGSNIYRRDERASADDKGRFHYAQGLSSESDVIELSSEKDNCIKLEDSNSIRDHRQGIRDFLENRGNLRGEHFGRSQHRSEFTQVVEVQQDNKPSGGSDPLDSQNTIQHQEIRNFSKQQKRDSLQHHLEQSQHLNKQSQAENLDWEEALSEKLDQYEAIHANRHQESIDFQHMEDLSDRESAQPQDLNEVPRRDSIERKDSPSELHDHFEALNAYLAEYERGGKQSKDSSERNNGMGHSCQTSHTTDQHNHFEDILGDYNRDQESKKSTSVLSDTHLVETVTIENGEAGNRYSHDVSWPTNTEDSRRVPENQIGRDMGDEALNDFVMPSGNNYAHSNLYNNDSEEGVDTTTYNHSNGVLDSTGHLQHQDQNQYIHDRRHVVRILDRSLLDLDEDGDEDECLDAIEVERQNTYSSNDRDPDADTPCASNRMDPPDPLPAHRYPEGRRLSTPIPTPNDLAEAPEGATKEEIDLLNRFIDVASSDFGGQILAPESEARVRSAALKVGLTPKFVDQLLNTTMKPSENHEKNLAFVAPPELQEQQPSLYDGKNNYHSNDYSYPHQFDGDYGGDNETYNTADYSRSYAKQSRRSGYEDGNCNTNIWEFLGQNLVHLANVTAKTCGVNYHRNDRRNNRRYRDDGDSIVSAISWDGDHARSSSTSRRDRSRRRSREADDRSAADFVPEENSDCRQKEERTRHVTFEDHVDEQSYNPVVRNESPPREKITQLV